MQPLTGAAVASDDLFYVFDASTNLPKTLTKAEMQTAATAAIPADPADEATFEGEPVTYVATVEATAMSETYTVGTNKTVTLTAKTLGVLDPAPSLVITAPNALPAGGNASLAIVSQAAGVVTVRPATGAGDKASASIVAASGSTVLATWQPLVPGGNGVFISVVNGTVGQSEAAAAMEGTTTLRITLAMDSGTPASAEITDASGTGDPDTVVTIHAPATSQTTYNGLVVTVETQQGNSQPAAAVLTGVATLKIKLATDADGDVVPLDVQAGTDLTGLTGWPAGFTATVAHAGTLDSYNAGGAMAGGVAMAQLTSDKNQATAIAALIDAHNEISADDWAGVVVGTGTHLVTVAANPSPIRLDGGGANSAITSTLADLTTLLHAAPSTIIDCTAGAGLQTTVLEATAGVTLTGGSNVVAATIGTPAVNIGRLAVGFAAGQTTVKSVWTALFADPTGTNAGTWAKTYTGS
jgi:hypothetical protein